MGNENSSQITKTFSYGFFKIIAYSASILTIPILTNNLTLSEYGEITLIEVLINLLISLAIFGMPQAYIKLNSEIGNSKSFNSSYFAVITLLMIFGGIISFIVFSILYPQLKYLLISLFILILLIQYLVVQFRAKEKFMTHSILIGSNEMLIYVLPAIFILFFYPDSESYFWARLIGSIVVLAIILVLIDKKISIYKINYNYMKMILKYGAPLILISAGTIIFAASDRYIVGLMYGNEEAAIYGVASKLSQSMFQVLIFPISTVLFPLYINSWKKHGEIKTKILIEKWLEIYIFLSMFILWVVLLCNKYLIEVLTNNEYLPAAPIFLILTLSLLIYGLYYFLSPGYYIFHKTIILGKHMLIWAIINIVLSILISMSLDYFWISIITSISYLGFLLTSIISQSKFYSVKLHINIKFILKNTLFLFTLGIIFTLISVYLPMNNLINMLFVLMISFALYLLFNLQFVLKNLK